MTCTVLLWASFALSIRAIGSSSLTGFDAALLRFLVPVVVLAPWLGRTLRRLREQRAPVVVALGVGAGLPFFLVAAAGGRLTAAGMVGLVIPGTVPVFVALLTRSRLPRRQAFALGSILVGVALLAATWSANGGIVVLLLAGLMWSVYTVALRSSTLDPIGTALTLCLPSVVIAVPLMALGVVPSHLLDGTAAGRIAHGVITRAIAPVGSGTEAGVLSRGRPGSRGARWRPRRSRSAAGPEAVPRRASGS